MALCICVKIVGAFVEKNNLQMHDGTDSAQKKYRVV